MNIKKVPVEYSYSNLVHDPRQRGHSKYIFSSFYNSEYMNIKKVLLEYCFSNLVHDPRQRGH